MKTIYLFFVMNYAGSAPESVNYSLTTEIKTEIAIPVDSFIKQKSNINFIMYSFVEKKQQVNYVLEGRNENSGSWEIIDIKEGFLSPQGQKLAYYFRDTLETADQRMSYRVKRIWAEKKLIPYSLKAGNGVTTRAFKSELAKEESGSFLFINRENFRKVTVMYFDEKGNLVNSNEYLNATEIEVSLKKQNFFPGKYYVVIDGDGMLYPAKILEVE